MYRILSVLSVLLIVCGLYIPAFAQEEVERSDDYLKNLPVIKKEGRPTVGLVLCGGGAKGAAHIGAIKVLEEYGVPVDLVVGTSMGALVGGLYSMGYTSNQMDSIISNCDWKFLLSDKTDRKDVSFNAKQTDSKLLINIPFGNVFKINLRKGEENAVDYLLPSGYVSGQNVSNLLNSLSIGYQDSVDFMKMPVPFACVATDLSSGNAVVLKEGSVPMAMRASMAIPGFFSAVELDGKVLVDGGVVDNFPVDVARKMGADIIIGVDVQSPLATKKELKSINQVIMQLVGLTGNDLYLKNVKDVDIYIKPDVLDFTTFSFNKEDIDTLVHNGYLAALEKSAELEELVNRYGRVTEEQRLQAEPAKELEAGFFYIDRIVLDGARRDDIYWLKSRLNIKEKTIVDGRDILRAVSILTGTKAFASVAYLVDTDEETGLSTLTFKLTKGPVNVFGLGTRYDSEEAAAILMYLGVNVNALDGPQLAATGRLSYNPYSKVDFSYLFKNLPRINLNYTFRSVKMNIYESGEDRNYLSFWHNKIDFSLSNRYLRNFNFTFGAKLDFYTYKDVIEPFMETKYYKDGVNYLSYYFNGRMDNRDATYFPTKGTVFNVDFALAQTNFRSNFTMFASLMANFETVCSISDGFAVIPSAYGRFIIGNEHQLPFQNYIGGEEQGRYMPHQIPFIGINYADIFPNAAVVARLDFRTRVARKHYITAIGNVARYGGSVDHLLGTSGSGIWGAGIKYAYDTPIGPLGFNIHYSDYNKRVGAYVNMGYYF